MLFGLACAAAGAIFYLKKNDVPIEDIIRRKAQDFFSSFAKK